MFCGSFLAKINSLSWLKSSMPLSHCYSQETHTENIQFGWAMLTLTFESYTVPYGRYVYLSANAKRSHSDVNTESKKYEVMFSFRMKSIEVSPGALKRPFHDLLTTFIEDRILSSITLCFVASLIHIQIPDGSYHEIIP